MAIEIKEMSYCPEDYSRFCKAQLGHENDVVLKKQEKEQISWENQSSFSTTYHLLDGIWAAEHTQRRATALPLPSRVLWHRSHPAVAQGPPGTATPQPHLLHSALLPVPDKGR